MASLTVSSLISRGQVSYLDFFWPRRGSLSSVVSLRMNAGGIVYRDRVRVSSGRGGNERATPESIGPVPGRILPPLPRTPGTVSHVTARTVKQDMGTVM